MKNLVITTVLVFAGSAFASNAHGQLLESKAAQQVDPHAGRVLADWIDGEFAAQWKAEDRQPPAKIDDATFLRRVYLDLLGTIPPVATAREFLNSDDPYKRDQVIGLLLTERRAPANLARVWRRMMVPKGTANEQLGPQLDPWLQDQFAKNVPYDEFAKSLLSVTTAQATAETDPLKKSQLTGAVMFYQAAGGNAEDAADAVTRFFLGVRLGCAKCHDHPFADWKQEEFWGTAAFFSGIENGNVTDSKRASISPDDSEVTYAAKYLWTDERAKIPSGEVPREAFANWMTDHANPNFAATAVNRVWQHFCGKSLAGGVDDLDEATTEERAKILDKLAAKFIESDYDMHELIRGVLKSRVYQAATLLPEHAGGTTSAMADVRPLKTLSPEQVFDSLEQALMLPKGRSDNGARFNGQGGALMQRLDEAFAGPPGDFSAGIPQALLMMNGNIISEATNLEQSRTLRATVDAPFLDNAQKLETLFLAALTRKPTEREKQKMMKYVETTDDKGKAFSDIFWSLLNTPEFVLSR